MIYFAFDLAHVRNSLDGICTLRHCTKTITPAIFHIMRYCNKNLLYGDLLIIVNIATVEYGSYKNNSVEITEFFTHLLSVPSQATLQKKNKKIKIKYRIFTNLSLSVCVCGPCASRALTVVPLVL